MPSMDVHFSSSILYYGRDVLNFADVFREYGRVYERCI